VAYSDTQLFINGRWQVSNAESSQPRLEPDISCDEAGGRTLIRQ